MRPTLLALSTALLLQGCVGEAEWALAPQASVDSPRPGVDAPVRLSSFQGLSAGLPSAAITATAQLDGQLYAAAGGGLYVLPTGGTSWATVTLPLKTGEQVSSVTRLDTAVYVTLADGAGHGGLLKQSFGEESFSRLAGAPDVAMYALVKKNELLVAAAGGLWASADRGVTWVKRSTGALFSSPVRTLVASASALRLFAVSDGLQTLAFSDDAGATWSTGLVTGPVLAVQASGEFVLVQTATATLRSDNYGNTFKPAMMAETAKSFAVNGKRAFAGTQSGVRVSDDGGATWRDASEGLPAATEVKALFLAGSALLASSGEQVYVATVQ